MGLIELGAFLKALREQRGYSLREVEKLTRISNANLSILETGRRANLPSADLLGKLADLYSVNMSQLLELAGYLQPGVFIEREEDRIDRAFKHVLADPDFKFGTRVRGEYDLDAKRFIIEMYDKVKGTKLLEGK